MALARARAGLCAAAIAAALGIAAPARAQVTIFVNHTGGVYTPGRPNDSRSNVTSVPSTRSLAGSRSLSPCWY